MSRTKLSVFLIVCLLVIWSATAKAAEVDYFGYQEWGGTYADAEKQNSRWNECSMMCWAATASNVLQYTGWAPNSNLDQTDEIFRYFQDSWSNTGGGMKYGWNWWFNGTNPMQGEGGWAQVTDPNSGNFYSSYNYSLFLHEKSVYVQDNMMLEIDQMLRAGNGVGLLIRGSTGHAITAWGFRYDTNYAPTDRRYYLGVWITDSDDNIYQEPAPDVMYYTPVADDGGITWDLPQYRDGSYFIEGVQSLEKPVTGWKGGTGSWHTASNWENGLPDAILRATIDGGTAQVTSNAAAGTVEVGAKSAASVSLNSGTLSAREMFVKDSGTLSITNSSAALLIKNGGKLSFAANTHYSAVTGAKIYMENNTIFDNRAISTLNLAGMNNTTFVYNGTGPASYSLFEIAGKNFGAVQSGFTNNYALKGLYIGYDGGAPISAAQLRLINLFYNFDPQGPQSPEALYVNTLILGQGSTLDLNNLTVYALAYTNYGGTVLNGSITIVSGGQNGELVPEPLSAVMLAFSACASFAVLRRRAA